jgi:light-harvesting complex II chlorophyll a/b binding protein 4
MEEIRFWKNLQILLK